MENTNPTPGEEQLAPQNPAPAVEVAPSLDDIIAEAEQRGYRKAVGEMSRKLFDRPLQGSEPQTQNNDPLPVKPRSTFLSRPRQSVWDL